MTNTKYFFPIYIILIGTLGQITADLYLPSLPYIQQEFGTSANHIQLSMAFFMYGFSFFQLIYGSLSDAFGRKRILFLGLNIVMLGTIIIILCNSITILLLGRLIQGIGVASCHPLSRAMLRDLYDKDHLARIISYITTASVFVIASAPLLGGYIQSIYGWRENFSLLLIYIILLILIQYFFIQETNSFSQTKYINPKNILKSYIALITHKTFLLFGISNLLAYGGLIAWLTTGTFIIQIEFGYSTIDFGYICAILGGAFAFGAIINSKIVTLEKAPHIIKIGFIMIIISGTLLLISLMLKKNIFFILIPILIYFLSASAILPNTVALGLQPFPNIAGLAAGALGCMQILGGAISSNIVSYTYRNDQTSLALIYITIGIVGLISSLIILKHK
ncbi:MAG: multidrug effflux MFS transporter [Legionellales bacterium]|nr:multidrug effflux MFS transporter [Legionellales bacterium]